MIEDLETVRQFFKVQPSSITLDEWTALDEETRAALVQIAEDERAERMYTLAMVILDEGSRAAIQDRAAPGSRQARLIDDALDMAAAAVGGGIHKAGAGETGIPIGGG